MALDDYDLDGLSKYLHLDLATVKKMAERGKIPGRRVNGQWRFVHAEVHHWLEERIRGADEKEQARIESVLGQHIGPDTGELTLDLLLPIEAVAVPLAARTKSRVISSMVELASGTGYVWDPERLEEAVRHREELFSTAIAGGVALMHPRRPMGSILGQGLVAFGATPRGIPFGDPGGGLTDLFFLILSMDDSGHLRTLARLGRVLGTKGMLDSLREAESAGEARELLTACDRGMGTA